jgi:hypothetical protein
MTRLPAPHDLLDTVPPWPRPLVPDLRHAPELAVLTVLHVGLRAALVALTAEHPTLDDLGAPGEPPTLRQARRLVGSALALSAALDDYRRTVIAALGPRIPPLDDLPF